MIGSFFHFYFHPNEDKISVDSMLNTVTARSRRRIYIITAALLAASILLLLLFTYVPEFLWDNSMLYVWDNEGIHQYQICESREILPSGFVSAGNIVNRSDREDGIFWTEDDEWLTGREVYTRGRKRDVKEVYIYAEGYGKNPWIMFRELGK